MRSARHLSLSVLVLATGPLFWLACGGGKPPETPADESSSSSDDSSSSNSSAAASSSADMPAASGAAADDTSAAPAASSSAPAKADAPPAAPTLGSTDCGKCIDTTCAKPAAACGKNSSCQDMIDAIHGCSGAAASCIDGATPPSAAKPKKLAAAYGKCAKTSLKKACKAQCAQ